MSAKPLPIMGLYHVAQGTSSEAGRVFVYGDSSCLDSGIGDQLCLELLRRALSYAVDGLWFRLSPIRAHLENKKELILIS